MSHVESEPISPLTMAKPITDRARTQFQRHNTKEDGTPYRCGCRSCYVHRVKVENQ